MEKYFVAALTSVEQIGPKRATMLIKNFGSARAAWSASEDELSEVGLSAKVVQSLVSLRKKYPNMADEIMARCEMKGIGICAMDDENYPDELRSIGDAPPIFYYKGTLRPTAPRVSIVGTRAITSYGERAASRIAEDLARAGITVVSGGANGIDTFAHRGALNGGRTVAVLGCGIEFLYSIRNSRLFERIIEGGAVISEYPPKMPPMPGQFPRRNRIIAGLSRAVVVVEAGKTSGALNTAQHAIEYGRKLFAVPGSVFAEKSRGCNELIRRGALLARDADDILNLFEPNEFERKFDVSRIFEREPEIFEREPKKIERREKINRDKEIERAPELDGDEALVYSLLDDQPCDLDELLMRADAASDKILTPQEISNALLTLELKGLAMEDECGCYSRR